MKAFIVCDEIHDGCDMVLAETAGRARVKYGSEWGVDRWDLFTKYVKVRRAPKCDGFEGSSDALKLEALKHGYFSWIILGCGCSIEGDEVGDVVLGIAGHTWCCEAHRAGESGGAKGCRHWA